MVVRGVKKLWTLWVLMLMGIMACSDSDPSTEEPIDDFDRSEILVNWADNIIIPNYQDYVESLTDLKAAITTFGQTPTADLLADVREAWLEAYLDWQRVSMFEIGKAESVSLRNFTNIYPADIQKIDENINTGSYNLELPSTNDEQGFPALDYLLYGKADTDEGTVAILSTPAHKEYLQQLVERLHNLASEVLNHWTSGYRDTFVANNGSSATSSLNKLANDFMFYYEKSLRAGKVGIPAGVFSTSPLPEKVEARFSAKSKLLFLESLDAVQDFFNGTGSSNTGKSFAHYLDYLNTIKEGEDLSALINSQLNLARQKAEMLNSDFAAQIDDNNVSMLETYDELQKVVVLLKVDMFQALSIQVDFVDADGD
ncbi:imelysin family protein [Roseivirga sp. UBA838]|uniref:imelysin family protein n=1 Tax=Roseivirga sp. UBA838 TaxID=1947393 RepID=UPI00257B34EE|nr:imelysin family protein [Roseivirga sp. UBA838]|tara:strand:+ start:25415 stop:26524 length:1110 start_codon:yes stop_codon:yes gene_type:complete